MKKHILKPLVMGVLASAVMTACGGGSSKSGTDSGAKAECKYNIQGDNPVTIMMGEAYVNPAVRVTREGKDVTFKVEGSVDSSKLGRYDMTYSSESCSNSLVRTVTVTPASCTYSLSGDNPLKIHVGDTFTDPGVVIKNDATGATVTGTSTGDVDTSVANSYKITYASESCKNTQTRIVEVLEKEVTTTPSKCIYDLKGDNPLELTVGSDYKEQGVSITDANGKAVEGTISGSVESAVGEYKITYQSDSCSNTETRIVNVVAKNCTYSFAENTNPLTIIKGSTYTDVKPTVKNAAGKEITADAILVKSNNVDTSVVKDDYEVVYEGAGCPNTAVRHVKVELPNCTYKFPNDKQTMDLIAGQNYVSPNVTIEGMPDVVASVLSGEVKKNTPDTYTLIYGVEGVCANTANFIVNVKKITDEELKTLKEEIGKTILPKI